MNSTSAAPGPRSGPLFGGLIALALTVFVSPATLGQTPEAAVAETAEATTDSDDARATARLFRGSTISWRNSLAARTLDPAQDLTYDPYFGMSLNIHPRFWVAEKVVVDLSIGISREFTHSNVTSMAGETWFSDLQLGIAAPAMVTIPVVGIDIGVGLKLTFPTSPTSQARTLIMGMTASLSLGKTFDVLNGISLGYGFGASKFFHEYTTGAIDDERYAGCLGPGGGDLSSCLSTGYRNSDIRLTNSFSLGVGIVEEFGINAWFTIITDLLYEQSEAALAGGFEAIEGTDSRHLLGYGAEVYVKPWSPLTITLGLATVNPQQAPDGANYTPFFNRHSELYLDFRLDIAGLVAELLPAKETSL